MDVVINSFKGENEIYSNFYPVIVRFEGMSYPTVEHAYQASKSKEFFFRKLMVALPADKAGLARSRGRTIRLRSDWEEVKINIMYKILCQKFDQEPFKSKLFNTGDAIIIEGNYHHDNIWGDCYCKQCKDIEGQNWLGRLIMDIRSQIIEKGNYYRRHPQQF